jgi:hypothetical protein
MFEAGADQFGIGEGGLVGGDADLAGGGQGQAGLGGADSGSEAGTVPGLPAWRSATYTTSGGNAIRVASRGWEDGDLAAMLRSVHLYDPISAHTRTDFATLRQGMTVQEALAAIRQHGVGERIVYFYVLDDEDRLAGVVPTRRLLIARLESPLSEIMIRQVVAIPDSATVVEACEFFFCCTSSWPSRSSTSSGT